MSENWYRIIVNFFYNHLSFFEDTEDNHDSSLPVALIVVCISNAEVQNGFIQMPTTSTVMHSFLAASFQAKVKLDRDLIDLYTTFWYVIVIV